MDKRNDQDDRNEDRKRDASNALRIDRSDVNRQRVDEDSGQPVKSPGALTRREREARWPIG
jgi:hypothetical protein